MAGPTRQRERSVEVEDGESETETGCPECESTNLVQSGEGELVCDECGLILEEENIDRGPEWRAFNHTERQNKSRV
ncbi:MAG: TFIIB-type zinc ribbon-containing protein, partial [Haloarculaceae archaeon]